MTALKLISDGEKTVSPLRDPFSVDGIEQVFLFSTRTYGKEWMHTGSIKFLNGMTKGEQEFKGESVSSILSQMKSFVETLEKR